MAKDYDNIEFAFGLKGRHNFDKGIHKRSMSIFVNYKSKLMYITDGDPEEEYYNECDYCTEMEMKPDDVQGLLDFLNNPVPDKPGKNAYFKYITPEEVNEVGKIGKQLEQAEEALAVMKVEVKANIIDKPGMYWIGGYVPEEKILYNGMATFVSDVNLKKIKKLFQEFIDKS